MKKINFKSIMFFMLTMLIATSCGTEDPVNEPVLPVADFEFVVQDSTGNVTFTNKSENAVSYEWEFGDNSNLSTEKDPVHSFEKSGTYEVVLTASNSDGDVNTITKTVEVNIIVAKPELAITIDGSFSDWDNIPYREDILLGGGLQKIKIAATDKTVYIYMEGAADLYTNATKNSIFFDLDYNTNTGYNTARLKDGISGADCMQEVAGFHIWGWKSEKQIIGWDWIKDGWVEWTKVPGTITRYEWKLDLKYARAQVLTNNEVFQIAGLDYSQFASTVSTEKVRLFIWLRDANWQWVAEAPAQGESAITVNLNEYVEKE